MNNVPESVAAVSCVLIAAFVALRWLDSFRRRNDVLDRVIALEDAVWKRVASLEGTEARSSNLLEAHERLVARVNELDSETKRTLGDLASKWLEEIQELRTETTAAYMQQQRRGGRPI